MNGLKRRDKKYFSTTRLIKNRSGKTSVVLKVPEHFDIYLAGTRYEESMRFISNLDKMMDSAYILKIILDFSSVKEVKAAALVLLFASIEVLIKKHNKVVQIKLILAARNQPKARFNQRIIKETGLLQLCLDSRPAHIFTKNYLPIISGVGGQHRDEIVTFILQKIYNNDMSPELENTYASAVQEAINNVEAHAYDPSESKQWWVKCSYIAQEKQLYLVIYDRGVGIPQSLKSEELDTEAIDYDNEETKSALDDIRTTFQAELGEKLTYEEVLDKIINHKSNDLIPDEHAILVAMFANMTRRSGADEKKHGQGSTSIRALVKNNDNGVLWVYSNNGLVKYDNTKSSKSQATCIKLESPIKGTLIQWNIQVIV